MSHELPFDYHLRLVNLVIRESRYPIPIRFKDDLKQDLAIILYRCYQKFDPKVGVDFAGYAIASMEYFLLSWWKLNFYRKRPELSLEAKFPDGEPLVDREELVYEEPTPDFENLDYLEKLTSCLNDRQKEFLWLYYATSENGTEIADQKGLSRARPQQIVKVALKKIRQKNNQEFIDLKYGI